MESDYLNTETIHRILGIDEFFKTPTMLMELMLNKEERERVFSEFLEVDTDLTYDWFHNYFQEEQADRKNKKQDFTPNSISKILTGIVGLNEQDDGMRFDVAAGTGGITIQMWNDDRLKHSPFDYMPSMYYYTTVELSDRAIPFLIFNLAIRGMNATVVHGDSLLRKCKGIFFIQNDKDDFLGFSSINVMPYNETTENEFHVEFGDFRYPEHIESPIEVLDRLGVRIDGGQVKGIKTEG